MGLLRRFDRRPMTSGLPAFKGHNANDFLALCDVTAAAMAGHARCRLWATCRDCL